MLTTPRVDMGTAFSADERKALKLGGLLPPAVSTLEAQVQGAYIQYQRLLRCPARLLWSRPCRPT